MTDPMQKVQVMIRFDLRSPAFGAATRDLYREAIDMAEYADRHGFDFVNLSEHHGSDDGYNPSPIVLGGAIAARTCKLRITLGALILPLHDPIRVAEDVAALDNISAGRVTLVAAAGYVPSEFAMFGRAMKGRGKVLEEGVEVLRRAWSGEPFEYRDGAVRVTPRPVQDPLPIMLGGSTPVAARRAARIADGFVTHLPDLYRVYEQEARALGRRPAPFVEPGPGFVHVTRDPQRDWQRIAPHAMHEMNAYGEWAEQAGLVSSYHKVDSLEALRDSGGYAVVTPEQCVELARRHRKISLHPLMGGMDPALGWESLRLFVEAVQPQLHQ
ncbi:MAG: LLM class flavin-dependent oxidoreductase [Halioglobus sp.]|nr:LLM class flavin-dependent oxidoreductase [Halioglobus sp.]